MEKPLNSVVARVTDRIRQRSHTERDRYLARIDRALAQGTSTQRSRHGCVNLAHGLAACQPAEKQRLLRADTVNLGIVSAYNDMLSAHQPYQYFPDIIKRAAEGQGATAQFAAGVPAMCDGITQGEIGMELSLFSRDVIAMATAVGLSHQMFDAVLGLAICDKIVPGLLMGALSFPHLPLIMVPGGPMPSGISNVEKARTRQQFATGEVSTGILLQSEMKTYHAPGTCTFYGTANTNQVCMEAMGLHLPNAAFIPPYTPLRDALTAAAAVRATRITAGGSEYTPVGRVVSEAALVNAMVAVLATGGSTNHTIHLIAIARVAGITVNWDDFADLSAVVPLLARIYPNGAADVNQYHAAGGTCHTLGQLLDAGLLHGDLPTVAGRDGLRHWREEPQLDRGGHLFWTRRPQQQGDASIVRPVHDPFSPQGGLKLLQGNLGRAVIKISAVAVEHRRVQAPARVFASQEAVLTAFRNGELERDFVAVLRFQGPRANGMPELHQLTPLLGVLQDRGWQVALVTDGRMSGASGKVPVALHVTPEASVGGPLGRVRDGDLIVLDSEAGILQADVAAAAWEQREAECMDLSGNATGCGRELYAGLRQLASGAEQGAITFASADS